MCSASIVRVSLLLLVLHTSLALHAQRISGKFEAWSGVPARMVLHEMVGGEHRPVDSVKVDRKGRFAFPQRAYPPGFYRLEGMDGDVLDLVLDPKEPKVVLRFDAATPLQEHITVVASMENQRLWEYKRASRNSQERMAVLQQERMRTDPSDRSAMAGIAEREAAAQEDRERVMERLIAQDTTSTFSRMIVADRRFTAAVRQGDGPIAEVVSWEDPLTLRSGLLPRAVMAYLQAGTDPTAEALSAACDSLMAWTKAEPASWTYVRSFLLGVFSRFGPEPVALHLVDRYVLGGHSLVPPEPKVSALAAELSRVSVGKPAPKASLVDPLQEDTTVLSDMLKGFRYTVLFFYSSTCGHCHAQMPGLVRLHDELYRQGEAQVVGIALDTGLEEFQETIRLQDLPWKNFSELNGWGSQVAKAFGVRATPNLILLDGEGTIVGKPYDHEELRDMLVALLH